MTTPPYHPRLELVTDELHVHPAGFLERHVRRLAELEAERLERHARRLLLERYPVAGAWMADHPRALALLVRLRLVRLPTLQVQPITITTAELER